MPVLKTLNPLSVLAVCLVWLVAAFAVTDMIFQALVIVVSLGTLLVLGGAKPSRLALSMIPFVLFGIGFTITNVLFGREGGVVAGVSSSQAVFASASLSIGVMLALRTAACGAISIFFALAVEPGGFVRALVGWCRLPPKFGYAAFAAMQMVPAMAADLQEIRMARAMQRGRALRRLPSPFELPSLVVPLLAFAIRRASRTAIAMEARGFGASPDRTMINVPGISRRDAIFVVIGVLVLAGGLWLRS